MNDTKDQAAPNPSKVNPTVTIVIDGSRVGFKHNLTNLDMALEVVILGLRAVNDQRMAQAGEKKEESKIVIPNIIPPQNMKEL